MSNTLPPYTCTGSENAGVTEFFDSNGEYVTALSASACFADWYCIYITQQSGGTYTWRWRDGVNPDDPTTWPDYQPPENSPADPEPAATT